MFYTPDQARLGSHLYLSFICIKMMLPAYNTEYEPEVTVPSIMDMLFHLQERN